MKLSYRQKQVLAEVDRRPGICRSCTNLTLVALEKRGLVRLEFDKRSLEQWFITDAGVKLLKPAANAHEA
jgi:hypothetical protein